MEEVTVFKISERAKLPYKQTRYSAGYDLYSAYDYVIEPMDKELIKTDIIIKIPNGYYGRIAPRSGLAYNYFIDVGAGVIDSDYRGNVGVLLFNFGSTPFNVSKGDRIAQIIFEKIAYPKIREVPSLEEINITDRGNSGFGSTGLK
ncbi:dUTP pyrophosphatase [Flamingopox virus FGPVKD09]|uniref:Deoxyuridine 5'-triphosphate nucleotidohydrolase n=1 Tax=Flamingopox virus FGPVKD09 TaxID=2059380 RepID=A0A2H4X253_9POXV|nr:dUTPase [Flamingopox virus FGPVKD09]AUD40142.1 dUTP pyrophosphatase [Flamingopox virus FGPVKD09]WCB86877.1 CPPV066 dUTP pyrophosphatase [Cooks petrelpox virus]